jgi:nitrate/nitrite transport system substrate-binding protein
VELVREASWASLRDKVTFGLLHGAHMLAPMPLVMTLATDRPPTPIVSGMVLSRNGNGITVSSKLYPMLEAAGADPTDPVSSARALVRVARQRGAPIQLASVAPWSNHDLQLRDWLALAGPEAHHHLQIIPVPPVQMLDAFRSGAIEGCCVGEPWNSLLAWHDLGVILHSGHQIWPDAAEKVLGMRRDWAEQHPVIHQRLIRVLLRACEWLDQPENRPGLREILMADHYIGSPIQAMDGHPMSLFHPRLNHHFFRKEANLPSLSQAHWLANRLTRWNQLGSVTSQDVRDIIRPDLFTSAVDDSGQVTARNIGTETDLSRAPLRPGFK